ncbi:sensor histidine kinase [Rubripirellula amarantea]|nr:HAMP domain-containing sensor histidine kinase [Rubripirellula amarantea]
MSVSNQGSAERRQSQSPGRFVQTAQSVPSGRSAMRPRSGQQGRLVGRSPYATSSTDEATAANAVTADASIRQMANSVARLMSETAHDLRSPLTTIRESVRLVQMGEMGGLHPDQESMLEAAIDQCDCMSQMIDEMVQLERLRTGAPRANRVWIPLDKIRSAVDETLRPWTVPRNIELLWDVIADPAVRVYADASMIRRLIVNLVVNAIRVSHQGQCVLVRFVRSRDGEMIECGVIDQGRGMSAAELKSLASDNGLASPSGEGLGLTISRQLAAVHFSSLHLRSRPGDGTEVSFQLPASGPRSVASAWVRWRLGLQLSRTKPRRVSTSEVVADHPAPVMPVPRSSVASSGHVELNHNASKPRYPDQVSAVVVSLGAAVSIDATREFQSSLQSQLQMFELAYKIDQRRWVVLLDADPTAAEAKIVAIGDAINQKTGGVRTTWSRPQAIRLDRRRAVARISDLLVREELAASRSKRVVDRNEVRLGTAPIAHSQVATDRLDVEVQRLASQMRLQSSRLQEQARNVRHGMQ